MESVIYADILIVINVYVNYFLLLLTSYLSGVEFSRTRAVLTSLAAGFFSLIILIPKQNGMMMTVIRLFFLILIIVFSFNVKSRKMFIRLLVIFMIVNFVFAGLMLLLWTFFAPDNMYFYNGIVYFDIDIAFLVVSTVICYVILKLYAFFNKRKVIYDVVYNVEIYLNNRIIKCRGFVDSGNSLTDPFTGEPVIIASFDLVGEALGLDNYEMLSDYNTDLMIHYIPCESINNNSLLPIIRSDKITVLKNNKSIDIDRAVVGISKYKIRNGEFGVLLNSALIENMINQGD